MNQELKTCPHCGDEAWLHSDHVFHDGKPGYRVECEGSCHSMTCWWHTKEQAIEQWNRRNETGWQPIEKAPKDEQIGIDVFCIPSDYEDGFRGVRFTDVSWIEPQGWMRVTDSGNYDYLEEEYPCLDGTPKWTPTHWMPLPSSPEPEK